MSKPCGNFKDENGNWIEEGAELRDHVNDYFLRLFKEDDQCNFDLASKGCFPEIECDIWDNINAVFTCEEVKKTLFDMALFKAPRPVGFHEAFYQRLWDVIGTDLWNLAKCFFEIGSLPKGVNDILLCLIPKVCIPEVVTQLCPISLCNVSYKILTKTLTNRLKKLLSGVIGPFQNSFVHDRQITDNILVF